MVAPSTLVRIFWKEAFCPFELSWPHGPFHWLSRRCDPSDLPGAIYFANRVVFLSVLECVFPLLSSAFAFSAYFPPLYSIAAQESKFLPPLRSNPGHSLLLLRISLLFLLFYYISRYYSVSLPEPSTLCGQPAFLLITHFPGLKKSLGNFRTALP